MVSYVVLCTVVTLVTGFAGRIIGIVIDWFNHTDTAATKGMIICGAIGLGISLAFSIWMTKEEKKDKLEKERINKLRNMPWRCTLCGETNPPDRTICNTGYLNYVKYNDYWQARDLFKRDPKYTSLRNCRGWRCSICCTVNDGNVCTHCSNPTQNRMPYFYRSESDGLGAWGLYTDEDGRTSHIFHESL